MVNFEIKIISDAVCPWCYVGKKKLEAGIALYRAAHPSSADTFTTTWAPFYLNPDAPLPSIDKQTMYRERFGAERTAAMQTRLSQIGAAVGIDFKYGGRVGNTRDAHRLIQLGKTKGAETQTRVVEELFETYFEREGDVTLHSVLQGCGERAGLDAGEVKSWLAEGKGGEVVDREVRDAKVEEQVTGVPYVVLQGKYAVSGAQDAEVFAQLFEKVKAKENL